MRSLCKHHVAWDHVFTFRASVLLPDLDSLFLIFLLSTKMYSHKPKTFNSKNFTCEWKLRFYKRTYVTCFFCSLGPDVCCILRLSGPLKQQYAQVRPTPADTHIQHFTKVTPPGYNMWLLLFLQEHNLNLDQLLGPGPYKEQYRADMICWGETRRCQDPGFFCRLATRGASQPIWVCHHQLILSFLLFLLFFCHFCSNVTQTRMRFVPVGLRPGQSSQDDGPE